MHVSSLKMMVRSINEYLNSSDLLGRWRRLLSRQTWPSDISAGKNPALHLGNSDVCQKTSKFCIYIYIACSVEIWALAEERSDDETFMKWAAQNQLDYLQIYSIRQRYILSPIHTPSKSTTESHPLLIVGPVIFLSHPSEVVIGTATRRETGLGAVRLLPSLQVRHRTDRRVAGLDMCGGWTLVDIWARIISKFIWTW